MIVLGEKIKSLRKEQNITQEKLAEYLGISYQAVSKWENGTALPDITLIPKIANFFGVSADFLLGMKEKEQTEELKNLEKIYLENNRHGKMLDNINLSREVLKKYPRNYQWMLNLAYPLMQYNDTDEHKKYSIQHNFLKEAIKLCERILEDCTEDGIRQSAVQILCYCYPVAGDKDKALKLAESMPTIYLCQESLLTHIYDGDKKIKQCQNNIMAMIDMSAGLIAMLADIDKELNVSQKIELVETANKLFKLILKDDQNTLFYNCRLCRNYNKLSELWCTAGDKDKAIENLRLAVKCASAYDAGLELGEQNYKSPIANRCTFNPKSVGKNWEGTETELILRSLDSEAYNIIRDTDDYKKIFKKLI